MLQGGLNRQIWLEGREKPLVRKELEQYKEWSSTGDRSRGGFGQVQGLGGWDFHLFFG